MSKEFYNVIDDARIVSSSYENEGSDGFPTWKPSLKAKFVLSNKAKFQFLKVAR